MYCTQCGQESLVDAHFCASCGKAVDAVESSQSKKPLPVPVRRKAHPALATAPRWRRAITFIIDTTLVFTACRWMDIAIINVWHDVYDNDELTLFNVLLVFAYFGICECGLQATLGKLITRTKVVTLDGGAIAWGNAIMRTLCRFIPFDALSYLFARNARGWHDTLSGTLVVPEHYTEADIKTLVASWRK